jgi:hypothetical protein
MQSLISKEQFRWLRELSFRYDRSIGAIIRELIDKAKEQGYKPGE